MRAQRVDCYRLVRPALFMLPPEAAHQVVRSLLRVTAATPVRPLLAAHYTVSDPRLHSTVFGMTFPNPVGVAAGFDKNGELPRALACLGFGHVEIGAVTAEAQPGNPRPRLFRLDRDRALINRLGFDSQGADRVSYRLRRTDRPGIPVGINIGKSRAAPLGAAEQDYLYTYSCLARFGDYFVVNVSSPNTPGLRTLQDRQALRRILEALRSAGAAPLLVKLSPDLSASAVEEVLTVVEEFQLEGIVATNTTTARPPWLRGRHRFESGGLSGQPLEGMATRRVRFIAERTRVPVIGVGGVSTAEAAYTKIRAGASLVQLYTALVYSGPGIARQINEGLLDLLERDGLGGISEAVGADL